MGKVQYSTPMGVIHFLDPTTIQQIAAGEVIDRPASIVKELVENSLDAGATVVTIDVENGGLGSLQITDNGVGIRAEDLPLAPLPHTTSKISRVEDIFAIQTRGFRGEALASIAHVATLHLTSRHTAADMGSQVTATIAGVSSPKPVAHPVGTRLVITGLFDDAPVRRKFLKTAATEFGYIYEIVSHFALIFPGVTFVLSHNGKETLNTRGADTLKDRVGILLGDSWVPHVIPVAYDMLDIQVQGVIGSPAQSHPNRRWQLFGINGRPVKSQLLYKAAMDAYADVIVPKRFPLVLLSLSLPPDSIDVNVHPQKLEVKFQKANQVYEAVRRAISTSFQREESALRDTVAAASTVSASALPVRRDAVSPDHRVSQPAFFEEKSLWASSMRETAAVLSAEVQLVSEGVFDFGRSAPVIQPEKMPEIFMASPVVMGPFLQILDTYIVVQVPTGMWILDQHAVHERVLYERLKAGSDVQVSQSLLIPHAFHMPARYMQSVPLCVIYLQELGFEVEEFGPDQILVRGVPQWAQTMALTPFLEEIFGDLGSVSAKDIQTKYEKEALQMKACKAAIKAGKTLHESEVKALISDFLRSPSNYTCPHGRPLAKFFDRGAFEKWFLR